MGKFYGRIGLIETVETVPGVWEEQLVFKNTYGDVYKNSRRWSRDNSKTNTDITVSNTVSIVASPDLIDNTQKLRCIEWLGALWSIDTIDIEYPRLNLTLGGKYNGEQT